MSKRLQFDVELIVSDDVETDRAAEVLEAMLTDLQQDDKYHEVLVVDNVTSKDDAAREVLDVLREMESDNVETAIDTIDALKSDED